MSPPNRKSRAVAPDMGGLWGLGGLWGVYGGFMGVYGGFTLQDWLKMMKF